MTRGDVVARLASDLGDYLTEVGMTATDTAGNLKEPLDDALKLMGVPRADRATATPDNGDLFELSATVTTLRKVVAKLALRFDISTGGDSFKLQQVYANVTKILQGAEAELAGELASLPGGRGGFWTGVLDLGFTASPAGAGDEFAGGGG